MAYTATDGKGFRLKKGSLSEKLGTEFAAIKSETDSLDTSVSSINTTLNAGVKVVKVALAGGNANAFAFAWQNPESVAIMVQKLLVDITTQGATATSVIDIGVVANATSTADTLIDGLALTATGLFDNVTDKGTNGKSRQRVDAKDGTNDYVTGKILTANAAELVGNVYIEYIKV